VISALFREHSEEHFYYCSLITTGEARRPVLGAWSEEALDREVAQRGSREGPRWSYANSPYSGYGDEYFGETERLFFDRPDYNAPADQWHQEYGLRLRCMEDAKKKMDNKGFFGEGEKTQLS